MNESSYQNRVLACRFYNGTDVKPTENDACQFWGYESMWVHGAYNENWTEEQVSMKHYGINKALADADVPESLKCLLFNRYSHWIGIYDEHGEGFVKWFKERYLSHPTNLVKQQRILDCRYYNGEKECPLKGMEACYWDYERVWVTEDIPQSELSVDIDILKEMGVIEELQGEGTPAGIIAILYSRLQHWGDGNDTKRSICNWIRKGYQQKQTHRQLRKAKRIAELTPRCRFYHGESSCPYTDSREQTYWADESTWVDKMSDSYTFATAQKTILKHFPKLVAFCVEKHLPQSLIALFMNQAEHRGGLIESEDAYMDSLRKYYLKEL
jgi:hypothetical protein